MRKIEIFLYFTNSSKIVSNMNTNITSDEINLNIQPDLPQSVENIIQTDLYTNTGQSVSDIEIFNGEFMNIISVVQVVG